MNVLIVYATVEGQTGKIARFISDLLISEGNSVTRVDAGDKTADVSFENVDKIILAASVHERRHPKAFEVLVAANAKKMAGFDTLMLSVSMNAAFPEGLEEAQDYVDEMKMRTGLETTKDALVAGAVRNTEYDYYAAQVVRHVVMRGRDYNPASDAHEFTDWPQLEKVVTSFVSD